MEIAGYIGDTLAIETPANGSKAALIEVDLERKK